MVGMLIAGAEPLDAVRLQLILLWVLLGSVALAALIATSLGYRGFFTEAHQLREPLDYPRGAVTEAVTPSIGKPRLRGVSHQWAFFVSLGLGMALVLTAPSGKATAAAAVYAACVATLFGTSALYHRINWRSVQRAALDAPARPLGDLPADRRLVHPVRPAGAGRNARRRDPGVVWAGCARRDRAQARLDRRAELAGGADLRAARLGRRGRDAGPGRSALGITAAAMVGLGGLLYTVGRGGLRAPPSRPRSRPSSATTRSFTCW